MKVHPAKTVRKIPSIQFLDVAAFLLPFLVYLRTATRVLPGEDAGELVTAAYELGVPHPPSYPLWCLLAKGFTFLPVGSIAFRVALLSAVFGGLTSLVLARYLRTFGVRAALALAAALLFAFSRTFWSQAVIPEVYTLLAFFLIAILYALRRWSLEPRARWLYGAAVLFGFGASHHPVVLYLGPLFLGYVVVTALGRAEPNAEVRRIPLALLLAAPPFLLYAYLPLRARTSPFVNWGNPRTVEGAFANFQRKVYERGPDEPASPRTVERTARQVLIFAKTASTEFLPPALLLVALGLVGSFRRTWRDATILLLLAGACSFGFIWYTNFDLVYEHIHANSIFWIPAYLVGAIWFGIGAERLVTGRPRLPDFLLRWFSPRPVAVACLAFSAGTLLLHFRENDRSRCFWTEDYARNLFATLEPDAVFLGSGDHNSFPPIYLHRVLGERPDVLLADKYGYFEESVFEGMAPEVRRHRDHLSGSARKRFEERWIVERFAPRPVYFTQRRDMGDLPGWAIVPVGLTFKVVRDAPEDRAKALQESEAAWGRYAWRNREGESLDFTARIIVSDTHYARGWHFLAKEEKEAALAEFSTAVSSEAAIKQLWNNCGSALAEHGMADLAVAFYEGALGVDRDYESSRRNLAASYLNLGHYAQARAMLEDFLKESPRDRTCLLLLAATYEKEAKFQEAVNVFSEVARLYSDDPTPWVEAGRVLLQSLHDNEQARKLLSRALEIDPDRHDARMLLDSLEGRTPGLPEIPGLPKPGELPGQEFPGPPVIPRPESPQPPQPPLPPGPHR
ncbi:MAG TPA: DUF2723 domain-containing protein [Planctomycetota bacterium]|jgi:cytochrome c-type biogenesis protein CcmH/NrfG|nr:DUF2723 domain-containing protein [Planctomycetota bacterium]